MHELSIASAILDAVRTESARHQGSRLCKVGVRIGEWSGVEPEALRFCFQVLVKDSDFPALQLEIEACPHRVFCQECGSNSVTTDYRWACPVCGSPQPRPIGGDELELAYLEVDDNGTPAAGAQGSQ